MIPVAVIVASALATLAVLALDTRRRNRKQAAFDAAVASWEFVDRAETVVEVAERVVAAEHRRARGTY